MGALGALWLFGMDLSVIAMIGLLMLIGIVKKNAIMMIDVALDLQREQIEQLALAEPNVQRFMEGLTVRKIIVVAGKIINIVAG